MLRNDTVGHDRAKNTDITRNLKNATTRHYQNNPHMSMESAFAYIMSNSGIFRALPSECIEKARKYLTLPETPPNLHQLDDLDIHGIFVIPDDMSFNVGCIPIKWKSGTSPFDHNDPCDPSIVGPKEQTKPGTTVVHAERIVVDGKKMIKILEFENVAHAADLPDTYHMGVPKFYRNSTGIVLYQLSNNLTTVIVDMLPSDVFILEGFDQMIIAMKEAAARLSKINKTAKLEKEHSGKFTVSI